MNIKVSVKGYLWLRKQGFISGERELNISQLQMALPPPPLRGGGSHITVGKIEHKKVTDKTKNICHLKNRKDFVIDQIVEHWNNKGKPFAKARPDSQRTIKAKQLLEKLYKKYRSEIFDVIDRAHRLMRSASFRYRPKSNISLVTFLRITSLDKRYNPSLEKLGINSWFKEFQKMTDKELREKYLVVPDDKYPDLTKSIYQKWIEYDNELEPVDRANFIRLSIRVIKFAELNKIGFTTIVNCFHKVLDQDHWMQSNSYWDNKNTWKLVKQELARFGCFNSIGEIK